MPQTLNSVEAVKKMPQMSYPLDVVTSASKDNYPLLNLS